MGERGQSAAPIVRPSSVRRLYVDAALRWTLALPEIIKYV